MAYTGEVRPASITAAAERKIAVEILEERITEAETALEATRADFPRREKCRAAAEAADNAADKLDAEAATLREQLVKIEGQSAEHRAEAAGHRHAASRTAATLARTPDAESRAVVDKAAAEAKAGHLAALADTRAREHEVRH